MRVAGLRKRFRSPARRSFPVPSPWSSPLADDFMETTAATEWLPAGAAAIFVDLEYVAVLPLLSRICEQQGIDLRSYATEDHPMASRATHTIQSKERGAVNTQMIWDMAMYCSDKHQVAQILLVTDERLGKTLSSLSVVASRVSWASLELDMPQPWRTALGGSAKDFFAKQGGCGEGGGGPRNGPEVYPRRRRAEWVAGAPALVSLLREAVLRRGAADSPDVTDHPDASSAAAAPGAG